MYVFLLCIFLSFKNLAISNLICVPRHTMSLPEYATGNGNNTLKIKMLMTFYVTWFLFCSPVDAALWWFSDAAVSWVCNATSYPVFYPTPEEMEPSILTLGALWVSSLSLLLLELHWLFKLASHVSRFTVTFLCQSIVSSVD